MPGEMAGSRDRTIVRDGWNAGSTAQAACGFPGTPPPAIVHAVSEFIWGMSDKMRDLLRRVIPLQMRLAYRRRRASAWHRETLAGIRVHYMDHLSMGHFESTGCGGGSTLLRAWAPSSFGTGLVPYLLNRGMPKQARTFEWCAGPGFIGFSLLGAGLTETLCLADINPQAVAACRRTINDNALAARANVYKSDNLANIPQSEQWDLVVGAIRRGSRTTPLVSRCLRMIRIGAFTARSLRRSEAT